MSKMRIVELDAETHQQRQKNLLDANKSVSKSRRKWMVKDYLPGQVTYNLGEYPQRFSIEPTTYDIELLTEFAKHNVGLIQIHEEWNDPLRVLGADKFTSHDEEGFRHFIKLVHSLGMKIIPYISTGFFDIRDPDFREEWAIRAASTSGDKIQKSVQLFYQYAHCSPASPGWRAYLLPKLERILDEYEVDGLYDDLGYDSLANATQPKSHISPGIETIEHDAALEDLLGIVHGMVRSKGGIFKVHRQEATIPLSEIPVYDYLWVGESVGSLDHLREATKDFSPYVVPCPDMREVKIEKEDDFYLHTIPYLRFPLRVDGRPMTGERCMVSGIKYDEPWEKEAVNAHCHRIHNYYINHPDGPYIYGWWDSSFARPEARRRWFYYFDLYRPMVSEGSWVWIEVQESKLFKGDIPDNLVVTLFVNENTYLVLANYGKSPVSISTTWSWKDRESEAKGQSWTVPARRLKMLQRI